MTESRQKEIDRRLKAGMRMTAPNLLDPLGSGLQGLAKLHLGHLSKEIPAGVLLGLIPSISRLSRKSAVKTKTQADNNLCKIIALPYQVRA